MAKWLDRALLKFGLTRKGATPTSIQSNMTFGLGEPAQQNYRVYLDTYQSESWVYTCVYKIANSIARLPLKIYRPQGDKSVEILKHPFLDLMKKPNSRESQIEFLESIIANSELSGNAYLLKDEQIASKPKYLYSLISSRVKVKEHYTGYIYRVNEINKNFKPEDIEQFLYFNPNSEYYGLSAIAAGRYLIETNQQANIFNAKFFKQGATLDGVLEVPQSLTDPAYKRLRHDWNQRHTGTENAHKTGLLEEGTKYHEIGLNHRDMQFLESQKFNREAICSIFGVPPAVVGIFEYANYANAEMQMKMFWNETLIPKIDKLESFLDKILALWGDKTLYCEFDLSEVESLRDNEVQKSEIAERYFKVGIPLNQIIEKLNLPFDTVVGGDVGYIPLSLVPMGYSPAIQSEPEPEKPAPAPVRTFKSIPDKKKREKWDAMIKVTEELESKYNLALNKYFVKQRNDVLTNLNKYKNFNIEAIAPGLNYLYELNETEKDGKKTSTKKQIDIDEVLFDYDEETQRFYVVSRPFKNEAVSQQGTAEFALLNLRIEFDMTTENVVDYLTKNSLKRSTEIVGTSREVVRTALIEGVKEGESVAQLSKRIQEAYLQYTETEPIKGYAATRIARTEMIDASGFGSVEAYKQGDVKKMEWVAAFDDKTTDICIGLNNEVVEVGTFFHSDITGDDYEHPPAHVNCRSTVAPIIGV